MSNVVGKVKTASGKTYEVKWSGGDRTVYVSPSGSLWGDSTKIGQASSAQEAMQKADAWGYNK